MAFGSPESAGIPGLAHIAFTVKGNPEQSSQKKFEFHPSSRSRTTVGFVPRCPYLPYIFYGDPTDPDARPGPQLYHVIYSCKSATAFARFIAHWLLQRIRWASKIVSLNLSETSQGGLAHTWVHDYSQSSTHLLAQKCNYKWMLYVQVFITDDCCTIGPPKETRCI